MIGQVILFLKRTVAVLVIAIELKTDVANPNNLNFHVNTNFKENGIISGFLAHQAILFIRFSVPSRRWDHITSILLLLYMITFTIKTPEVLYISCRIKVRFFVGMDISSTLRLFFSHTVAQLSS